MNYMNVKKNDKLPLNISLQNIIPIYIIHPK